MRSRILCLSSDEIVAFQERVGFRWCAHKQQRLAVAAAYFRADNYSRKQAQNVVQQIDKLTVRVACLNVYLRVFLDVTHARYRNTPLGSKKATG